MAKFKKIPIKVVGRRNRAGRQGTQEIIRQHRKESNEDLMTQAMLHQGRIRLNILVRIKHWENGNYAGWNGSAVMVDAPTQAKAKEFYVEFKKAIVDVAQRLGLELPGAIVVGEG